MKLFSWKRKECCDCKKQIVRLERMLTESAEVQIDVVTQLRKVMEHVDARLKKLEAKKKPVTKKKVKR